MHTEDMIDLAEAEFTVVSPTLKVSFSNYAANDSIKTLLSGEAILVPLNTAIHRMYRFAKSKGYILHRKKVTNGIVLWLEKPDDK